MAEFWASAPMLARLTCGTVPGMTPLAEPVVVAVQPERDGVVQMLPLPAGSRSGLDEDMRWTVPFAVAMIVSLGVFVQQIATKTAML